MLGPPSGGLKAAITGVAISDAGLVTVTFMLTDAAGVAVTPKTAATSDPSAARVRFTIARLQVDMPSSGGFSTTFKHYANYITTTATHGAVSSDQPTYDSGGTSRSSTPRPVLGPTPSGRCFRPAFPRPSHTPWARRSSGPSAASA